MKKYWRYAIKFVRVCYTYIWNRQFLTFLFFFFLSFLFWVFFTLNETYEQEFSVPLEIKGKPKNVEITLDPPKEIGITLRDKGSNLLRYSTSDFSPIVINFKDYTADKQGTVKVPINDLRRQIEVQLSRKSALVRTRPETVEYMHNSGESKVVPVIFDDIHVQPAKGYVITSRHANINKVQIYALQSTLDTITAVYARPSYYNDVKGRQTFSVALAPMRGVKMKPDSLRYTVTSDIVSEKTLHVKVQGVNFPATRTLRTFPGYVDVTCKVPTSLYNSITAENFALVLDYETLLGAKSNKVRLALKSLPKGVISAVIYPQDVQFLIEQLPETDEE